MTLRKTILALSLLPLSALVVAGCTQNESLANDSGISYQKKDGAAPGIVAKFDGKEISLENLEKSSPDIYSARLEVYKAQKAALDEYIRNQIAQVQNAFLYRAVRLPVRSQGIPHGGMGL